MESCKQFKSLELLLPSQHEAVQTIEAPCPSFCSPTARDHIAWPLAHLSLIIQQNILLTTVALPEMWLQTLFNCHSRLPRGGVGVAEEAIWSLSRPCMESLSYPQFSCIPKRVWGGYWLFVCVALLTLSMCYIHVLEIQIQIINYIFLLPAKNTFT